MHIPITRRRAIIRRGLGELWGITDDLELGDLAYIISTLLVRYLKGRKNHGSYDEIMGVLEKIKGEIQLIFSPSERV